MFTFRKLSILIAAACACAAHADTYKIDASASRLEVLTAKAGMFSRAGHTHEILATQMAGEVQADPKSPGAGRLTLSIPAAGLKVQDPDLPEKDRNTVQKNMEGEKTLDVPHFPLIRFVSKKVTGEPAGAGWNVKISGQLELHGVTRDFTVPANVTIAGTRLTAKGEVQLGQKDFGITPFKAVLGAVGVKNEVKVRFEIVANHAAR